MFKLKLRGILILTQMKSITKNYNRIERYMISKGIEPKRISTIGYGENVPKYPNDSPENKALDRRIESKIVGN